jgi:hypothetical protein
VRPANDQPVRAANAYDGRQLVERLLGGIMSSLSFLQRSRLAIDEAQQRKEPPARLARTRI